MPTPDRPRRPSRRHAQLHLPPLSTDEATLVIAILERLLRAIWRVHGDAISDREASLGIETQRPSEAAWSGQEPGDDVNFE
jgi:hypothetical protein